MNFFSHFLVDSIPGNPTYNAALIAPDLFRHFLSKNNRFDWKKIIHQPQYAPENLKNFCQGSIQHINRDALFHQSDFFETIYQNHRTQWEKLHETEGVQRWWFTLHVSIELIIDKLLIENNLDNLVFFYSTLENETKTYLEFLDIVEHPEKEKFITRFNRFKESQYLFHYRNMEGILYALFKIHESLKIPTPWYNTGTNKTLLAALQSIETTIELEVKPQTLLDFLQGISTK
jgi:hypothetical protein